MLLLTGGSGLLGSGMIPHLRTHRPDRTIVILTRQPDAISASPGVVSVRADVSRDDLGLERNVADELRDRVTEIMHCAADVRFNATLEDSRRVNILGTRRLLDFAEGCRGLAKFAHVSTLYIAGRRPGVVRERELRHECGYFNVYEQAKHEAEHLVYARMGSLPLCVYRPSAIIGNAATGKVSRKNFFHALIALAPRAACLPCLPIHAAAPVDLIADDWCSRAIALLFDEYFEAGATHHLCAGREFSLTAREILNMVFRVVEEQTGVRIVKPPLGSWQEIERRRGELSAGNERTLLDLISQFLPHMAVNQPFDRGGTGHILRDRQLTLPAPAGFVERVIRQTVH